MLLSQWIGLFLLACGYALALAYGRLGPAAACTFIALLGAGWLVRRTAARWLNVLGHGLFTALAVGLAMHALPGFHNARVIHALRLTTDAAPFSMHLNLDKPLIALWLLLACPWIMRARSLRQGSASIAMALPLTAAACLGAAWLLDLLAWAPKWPAAAWLWALNNLLLVSLAEEALFRGYLQGGLQRGLARVPGGATLALLLAAGLFGLAHLGAGWSWVLLASLAGIGYGLAYRHGGLLAAVATHFGVNLIHFAGFTYPQLAIP